MVGDDEPFEEKIRHLTGSLLEQFEESHELETAILQNLKELNYGI